MAFSDSPLRSRIIERRLILLFRTKTSENAALCAAVSFACGLSAIAAEPIRRFYPLFLGGMLLVWAAAALSAGFLRQWFFPLFAAAFHLLPHLFIDAAQSPTRSKEFTALNDALALLGELIAEAAPSLLTERLGIGRLPYSEFFLIGIAFLFLLGFLLRRQARGSRVYCEARLKILENEKNDQH